MAPDRPALSEITAAMIAAGVKVLQESGRLTSEAAGPDRALVAEILHRALETKLDSRTTERPD